MHARTYKDGCYGCRRSQGFDNVVGGIVELEGDWILNQYWGEDGFLGWMALQPRFHRMELAELTFGEAACLGGNIQRVERALRAYWADAFGDDAIERVYVAYFFESALDPTPTNFHLYLHLIPRTRAFAPRLRLEGETEVNGWEIYRVTEPRPGQPDFPNRYVRTRERVMALMDGLRGHL